MFSVATTCVVLVFLSGINTLEYIGYMQEFVTDAEPAEEDDLQNLEIYATSESSISVRYNIPNETSGVPIEIRVRWLVYSQRYYSYFITPITSCLLFPTKYCADINHLGVANDTNTLFQIDVRNNGTSIFGAEKEIEAEVSEKVPGKVKIITISSYCPDVISCHLTINWNHPYNQNGSITAFNIIINSSETVNNVTYFNAIHESLEIYNQSYQPQYHYQIAYVPYTKKYNLYIQSENLKYKSDFTMVEVVNTKNARININENLVHSSEDSEPNAKVYQYILYIIVSFVIIALGTIFIVVRHFTKQKPARKQDRKRVLSNESEMIRLNGLTINNGNVIKKTTRPSKPIPDLQQNAFGDNEYEDIEANYNAYDHLKHT